LKKYDRKKLLRSYGFYVDLVLRFSVSILLFVFVGFKLDEYFNTKPALLIIFTFLGATAGFYSMYKSLTSYEKREKNDE